MRKSIYAIINKVFSTIQQLTRIDVWSAWL